MTLTAVVTPSTAVGRVRFVEVGTGASAPLGAPVTLLLGRAVFTLTAVDFGLHTYRADFLPDDPRRFAGSATAGPDLTHVVAKPVPAYATGNAVVTGSVVVGSPVTCASDVTGATTVIWAWLRDGAAISGAASPTYTLTDADRGHGLVCLATVTRSAGSSTSGSAPVVGG